ncbi:MAG: mechanosensitive ion channel family protein [Acidobacteria bacterium]|nr:MAG: mechanosensitive ion channel family protein [Acidobacteriota bacterium]
MVIEQDMGITKLREIITPGRVTESVVVLFFAWLVVHLINIVLGKLADRWSRYRLRILQFAPIVSTLVWSLSIVFIIFFIFQPDETTVAALLGGSAIAIGLAFQDTLKNFLGALTILMDQPFQVGDKVEIGPYYGEVVSIGMRSVKLVTNEDSLVTVPNSVIVNQSVSNANNGDLDCQVVADVYLPAHTDVTVIEELAWEAAATSPYVYLEKPIMIRIADEFKERPLTRVRIKAYVLDVRLETLFHSDVSKRAKRAFIEAGLLPPGFGGLESDASAQSRRGSSSSATPGSRAPSPRQRPSVPKTN